MTEPSREHVEAVATVLAATPTWWETDDLADLLLSSTDPAVLDAMQDALVRAGRLREQRAEWGVMFHDGSVSRRFNGRTAKARSYSEAGHLSFILAPDNIRPASRSVFVTEWQEVDA